MKSLQPIRIKNVAPGSYELVRDPRNTSEHYQKGDFIIGKDVPDAVVREKYLPDYVKRMGRIIEQMGFKVLGMSEPQLDLSWETLMRCQPDEKRYVVWFRTERRPVTIRHKDIPDEAVPALQAAGLKLLD